MANGLVGDAIGCDAATRSLRLSAAPEVNSSAAAAAAVGEGENSKKREEKQTNTKTAASVGPPCRLKENAAGFGFVFCFLLRFALKFIAWIRFVYTEAFDPAGAGDEEANQGGRGWAKTVNPT